MSTARPTHGLAVMKGGSSALVRHEVESRARVLESPAALVPPVRLDRPIRLGVINNPQSRYNMRPDRLASMCDRLERSGVPHREADTLEGIVAATQDLLRAGAELLVINGGDGTVHGVLTGLFRASWHRPAPLLAVLPGGTTNTTARNVGYAAMPGAALGELVAEAERGSLSGRIDRQPVMRVELGTDSEPLFAMFFGAGAVYHGIRFAKERVESRGLRGNLGAAIALAVFLGKIATGKGGTLFPPLQAGVLVDGEVQATERLLGILVSTMERQFLGLRPYWGEGPGPIRYSSLAYALRHLFRAAVPVMRGKPNRFVRPEFGYRSSNARRLELRLDSGFTLDGELFGPEEGARVVVDAEQSAFFLRREPG